MSRRLVLLLALAAVAIAIAVAALLQWRSGQTGPLPGMPPVIHRENLYSEAGAGRFSAVVRGLPPRVYVPDVKSGDVIVIDPASLRVIGHFPAGRHPQHVVPSYDLRTLWVAGSAAPGRGRMSHRRGSRRSCRCPSREVVGACRREDHNGSHAGNRFPIRNSQRRDRAVGVVGLPGYRPLGEVQWLRGKRC